MIEVTTLAEDAPGERWVAFFREVWPEYERWFLKDGERARPTYLASRRALTQYMPELVPLWEQLCELSGGSDRAARMLSLYRPPAFMSGCSQAVWTRDAPFLVRNYDYAPRFWERKLSCTRWLGRGVLGMSDCLWGILDGINDAGLTVSLSFGGRRIVGEGFGIPLILRYVLETCSVVAEAVEVLSRVPTHMAYSITVMDAHGVFATVFVAPDAATVVTRRRVVTNHQHRVEWVEHAEATGSVDRLRILTSHLERDEETPERFISRFLEPPTYGLRHEAGYGTLYTAVYRPSTKSATYLWPGRSWEQSIDAFDDRPFSGFLGLERPGPDRTHGVG